MIVFWIGVGLCGVWMLFWSINTCIEERDAAVARAESAEAALTTERARALEDGPRQDVEADNRVHNAIVAARDSGYRAGVEAAAKACECEMAPNCTFNPRGGYGGDGELGCTACKIAKRIRANCLPPPSDSRDQGERLVCPLCQRGDYCAYAPSPSTDHEVTK